MGRPPCCDKVGVKKGPWTPEEDIMLVSYVQEHGPGNWRAVPTTTGLRRCSKSCRLRWTNYLRPGIKRGSFTLHEEKMIIQLQALLGNKWAAIASYLPERTDNDIKNYWNTHLKKKLKKLQQDPDDDDKLEFSFSSSSSSHSVSRGQWEKRLQTDINKAKQALHQALSSENPSLVPESKPSSTGYYSQLSSAYISSTENIARLLKGWTKKDNSSPNTPAKTVDQTNSSTTQHSFTNMTNSNSGISLSDAFDQSVFGFESSNSDLCQGESKPDLEAQHHRIPLTVFEDWLFGIEGPVEGKENQLTSFSFDENAELMF